MRLFNIISSSPPFVGYRDISATLRILKKHMGMIPIK